MRISFIAKLFLKKCYVYIALLVQKLIQRTDCHKFQSAKERKKIKKILKRSVPRTVSVVSDHRGY